MGEVKVSRSANSNIRRILVSIDGSESADNALNIATKIAVKYSAKIDLIHVGRLSSLDNMLIKREKSLVALGLSSRTICVDPNHGNIGEHIVSRATEGDYDLLAIGSRGLGKAKGFFLGSVSKKVAEEAKCAVIVAKSRIDKINRVLLGYDGSKGSERALRFVADLAKKFNAVVNVVSAISEPMLSSELDVRAAVDRLDREMSYYSHQASLSLKELGVESESAKVVGGRKISLAITREAEHGEYDIVTLGNRGWGKARSMILGSIASSVLDNSNVSLLIVK